LTLAEWPVYKNEFGPQGRARQIMIPNTSPADWQLWLDYLAATDVEIRYFVDGNPVPLPEDVREMLRPDGRLRALHIQPRGLSLTADLSIFDQIRLCFDPARITDEDKARVLFHMMSTAGRALEKGVVLAGPDDAAIFQYLPGRGVEYVVDSP
jgi:hypothetical protein